MMNVWKKMNRLIAIFTGAMLVLIMLIVVADILFRLFLNHSITGVIDIVTILMPVLVFLPMAFTEFFDGHIRVEVLTINFSKKWNLLLEAVASLFGMVLLWALIWQGYEGAIAAWKAGTYHPGVLRIPLYPSLFAIVLGFILWWIHFFIKGVHSIREFMRQL